MTVTLGSETATLLRVRAARERRSLSSLAAELLEAALAVDSGDVDDGEGVGAGRSGFGGESAVDAPAPAGVVSRLLESR